MRDPTRTKTTTTITTIIIHERLGTHPSLQDSLRNTSNLTPSQYSNQKKATVSRLNLSSSRPRTSITAFGNISLRSAFSLTTSPEMGTTYSDRISL
jgi:hypothetical protein